MSEVRQHRQSGRAGQGPGGAAGVFGPPGRGPGMMGMPGQKAKNFKAALRRLIGYMKPHRIALGVVCLTAVLSTVFAIVSPKLMGEATTKLFEGMMGKARREPGAAIDFAGIADIILVLVALYAFSALFAYVQQHVMAGVAQRIVYKLREDVNRKLSRLPLKYFDSRPNGEILSRVVNDVDTVSSTLQQSLTQFITAFVTLIGVVIMMLSISPLMTLIVVLTVPLSLIAIRSVTMRSQQHFRDQQKALGELNGHVEEMYAGHAVVKAFGREKQSVRRFDEVNAKLYDASWRAQFISGIIMPMMNFIGNLGYVAVCVAGGILVMRGSIRIGDVQAFISYSKQFTMPITQTAQIANIIQSTVAAAERVFELLDEPEEIPDPADAAAAPASAGTAGNVRFEHIRFGYSEDAPLMDELNVDVRAGQTVAIVGPTGAGKTTLVNLLMRFYELQGGRITIDGTDVTRMKRSDLRGLFGMVLQDTWLFGGTIRDNIAYGRAGASEKEIVRAAQAANADHFIRTLPDGYDTVLNEEATNLSQGQKQLLTIARAILADPAILLLDEATSSVDTRTEIQIQKAMKELMKGRTSFVIAHRLSTIRDADLILVMNKGAVVEQGTHEELLARGGFYAELYKSQFAGGKAKEAV
ncbi:ABC transporter ATP-binding protein [Paenibacillus thermoaerophilus]|uniref:ABC transporter ATP-binding protein n=1 Tax=Paenibacillus thermoaerophilus TaxID=1215385 RepID=A0ABW2V4J5_9BACL|nr:ABC transporter ATP-binding protein [Paenibacillus thermoaerophilus]TMV18244.1 ABC transporter ATP-binding protein [Paenibacillus thermoaerophilus]